jgi:hypothetical protein
MIIQRASWLRHAALLAALSGLCTALACVAVAPRDERESVVVKPRGKGPPPHAPAHGYRRKLEQDGVTLVLDTGRNVYVVVELESVFFFENRYFRRSDDRWYASSKPQAGWVVIAIDEVPPGLRDYAPGNGKKGKKR